MDPMHPSTATYLTDRDVADEYDHYFAGSPLFDFDTTLLTTWFDRPGRLLDIGCGTARHVIALVRQGHRVVGMDLSEHMLSVAREKMAQAGVTAPLVRADMMDLSLLFRPATFDYAACMFSTLGLVAGHANRRVFLADVADVLRPGGKLALHVHNRWYGLTKPEDLLFIATNLWQTWRGRAELGDKILWHYRGIRNMYVHVFSLAELRDILSDAGFLIRQIVPLNRRRSGALRVPVAAGMRANGFIVLAERPE